MSITQYLLRRNSRHLSQIQIDLNEEEDDAAIAQALEQNQYVSRVSLRLARRSANWEHLCRVIATRGNLLHFVLLDDILPLNRVPADRIRPILQAIKQNSSVSVVECRSISFTEQDLCSFLDSVVHTTDLTLKDCKLTGGEQGARDIAAALQRNTNIVTLKLSGIVGSLDTVLEGLVSNTCLRNLVIQCDILLEETTRNALRVLLESTRSIQHLELFGSTLREESFRVVVHGLINRSTVTDITLNNCRIQDEGSIRLLNQILGRKQNLHTLAIKDCEFYSQRPQFLQALFSALRRSDSPLRHFLFEDGCHDIQSFRSLCEAVAVSKLESFSIIGVVPDRSRIAILADFIPSMKIREILIQFGFLGPIERYCMKHTLFQAVKNNYTLQSVKYQYGDTDSSFDPTDETLKIYLERNIRLAQWVENPATVPKHTVEGSDDACYQGRTRGALSAFAENWTRSVACWWSQEKTQRIEPRLAVDIDYASFFLCNLLCPNSSFFMVEQ